MISEILSTHANTLQKIWQHDRTQTIGASEIGQCARKTFWIKNEIDATHRAARDDDYSDRWGAQIRGTIMENEFWFPAMKARYGMNLLYAGPDQKTFVSGFLSATPDGLVVDQPNDALAGLGVADLGGDHPCFMVECKTVDPRTNMSEAKSHNIYQTQVQMGLVREFSVLYQPNYSLLSYTDASFWDEVTEFVIPFDQKVYDVAKGRAAKIMTATDARDLKPEGWIAGGRECNHCPFTKACGIERRSLPEVSTIPDQQFIAEITDLCRQIKQIEASVEGNTALMKSLQDDLKNRLRDKGIRKIKDVVSWSAVKGRSGWDNTAIREALAATGADLEPFATKGEPTDRLVIALSA